MFFYLLQTYRLLLLCKQQMHSQNIQDHMHIVEYGL